MKTKETIIRAALDTISIESQSIKDLQKFVNDDFVHVVELLFHSKGRAIFTGIGKSAIIGQKIVATLNSTGTPSVFMHAADAIHGDLGIIQTNDVIICISKSGNTPEINALVPFLKAWKNKLVAMTGNADSYLGKQADYVLNTYVEKEACPNNLAPTSSSTAQLVMGDALAVSLLTIRGFSSTDFAKYHPGGTLGKQLFLKVSDLYTRNERPSVNPETSLQEVIMEISSKRLGATAVVERDLLVGVITDGDLRRMLLKGLDIHSLKAKDIMNWHSKRVQPDMLVTEALKIMKDNSISQLLVCDALDKYLGIIHIHDIIKEGLA